MRAAFRTCRGRGVAVVLASGTAIFAIGLSALTGGIAPVLADPLTGPSTTPVSPPRPAGQAPQPVRVPDIASAPPPQASPVTVTPPTIALPRQPKPVVTPPPLTTLTVTSTAADTPATTTGAPKPPAAALPTTAPVPVTTTIRNTPAPATTIAAPTAVAPQPGTTVAESPPPPTRHSEVISATAVPPTPPSELTSAAAAAPSTPAGGSLVVATEPATGAPARTSNALSSSSLSQAGPVVEVHQADRLQAPQHDVELARASAPIEQRPDAAPAADVDQLRTSIRLSYASDGRGDNVRASTDPAALRGDWGNHDRDNHDRDRTVRQWDRDWVQYDDYYRPILCNPYHDTVKVVYVYQYETRIVVVPPLGSVVLDALDYGAYNFTALLADPVGTAANVAVGSFFGGGYDPAEYPAPPPPPPPLVSYDDVPVVVSYRQATYEPFRVRQVVDVGDDAGYGEHKVLLDGVTPVWGQWTQTADGQRQFEVHKTQRFPGLEDPQEGPLPGDYQLRLANTASAGLTARDVYVIAASAVVVALAITWGAAFGHTRWRRRTRH
jgi:hypothetical protein